MQHDADQVSLVFTVMRQAKIMRQETMMVVHHNVEASPLGRELVSVFRSALAPSLPA